MSTAEINGLQNVASVPITVDISDPGQESIGELIDTVPRGLFERPYPHVAIIGKMGAGKTTGAEFLVKQLGYTRLSFANLLKSIAMQIWGPNAFQDRDKLQKLGKTVRDIDEDAWVNGLLDTFYKTLGPVVIDDCRFPNEYWALKARGFVFVRVNAAEETRVDRLQRNGKLTDLDQLNHVSESHVDSFEVDADLPNGRGELFYTNNLLAAVRRLGERQ